MITIVSMLTVAYAVTVFTTQQTLTVPETTQTILTVYESDGTTEISEGQNITEFWIWNTEEYEFELTLNLKNTGSSSITPSISVGNIPDWSLGISGLGPIAVDATLTVDVTMTPNTHDGGETTGDFTLSIGVS